MFKAKNVCLIISAALAILCLIFMIYSFCDASTGENTPRMDAHGKKLAGGMACWPPPLEIL